MPLHILLIEEPWNLTNGKAVEIKLPDDNKRVYQIHYTSSPSLLIPYDCKLDIDNQNIESPFIILKNQKYRLICLPALLQPLDELRINLTFQKEKFSFTLCFPKIENPEILKSFIRRQIDSFQRYFEIEKKDWIEFVGINRVRASWQTAQSIWLNLQGEENDTLTSLVARLAKDNRLINSIKTILSSPNKALKRQPNFEQIAKVVELDVSCLQWLIRQPGTSILEKAGPKQKILAITRKETFELFENRVASWVIKKIIRLSSQFMSANRAYHKSEKFNAVSRLSATVTEKLEASSIKNLLLINHSSKPNYPLTQNPHYNIIWKCYLMLRAIDKYEEDCWKWQDNLWSETCRHILGSIFVKLAQGSSQFIEVAKSSLYVRKEQMDGFWTDFPLTPGPFYNSNGYIHYLDIREINSDDTLCNEMKLLGASQVLYQINVDGTKKRLYIWFWNSLTSEDEFYLSVKNCHNTLSQNSSNMAVSGLILASETKYEKSSIICIDGKTPLTAIKLSKNYNNYLTDIESSIIKLLKIFEYTSLEII